MKAKLRPWDDDPRHGTVNGYVNLGCRCADCREAGVADARARQLRRARPCSGCEGTVFYSARGDLCRECLLAQQRRPCPSAAHYNRGCRCDECRALVAARQRKYRKRAA